eukprot:1725279-Pleurochrysis_carterae.AAC.4
MEPRIYAPQACAAARAHLLISLHRNLQGYGYSIAYVVYHLCSWKLVCNIWDMRAPMGYGHCTRSYASLSLYPCASNMLMCKQVRCHRNQLDHNCTWEVVVSTCWATGEEIG